MIQQVGELLPDQQRKNTWLLKGLMDVRTVPTLLTQGEQIIRRQDVADITIDLSQVAPDNTDSAAVALLIEWLRLARMQNKSCKFIHLPEKMQDIMRVCYIDFL